MVREAEEAYGGRAPFPEYPGGLLDYRRVTGDGVVVEGRVLLWGILLSHNTAASQTFEIRDGMTDLDPLFWSPSHPANSPPLPILFPKPIPFYRGIFVDFTAAETAELTFLIEFISPYRISP